MESLNTERIKRKSCYLCTTPLQVLGAIALEQEKREGADIFLFDDNKDYLSLGKRLRDTNIFENVYCVDFYSSMKSNNRRITRFLAFLRMAFCSRYVSRIIGADIIYENLYASSSAVSKMVVASGLYKKNQSMNVYMYDDGIGSYSKSERVKTGSALFQKAKRILKWEDILSKPKAVYLYQPELAADESNTTIKRMPTIKVASDTNNLASIFTDENLDDLLIDEKVIIFDTFRNKGTSSETLRILDEVYERLGLIYGQEKLVIKVHPRSTVDLAVPIKRYSLTALPVEIVYMRQTDLRDKILVALNSSAVFTPKMLFGEEPYVILLYRLVSKDAEVRKKRDDLYLHLLSMYEDQSRICIPETFEALNSKLDEWMSES